MLNLRQTFQTVQVGDSVIRKGETDQTLEFAQIIDFFQPVAREKQKLEIRQV